MRTSANSGVGAKQGGRLRGVSCETRGKRTTQTELALDNTLPHAFIPLARTQSSIVGRQGKERLVLAVTSTRVSRVWCTTTKMGPAWRNVNPFGSLRFLELAGLKLACVNLVDIVVEFSKYGDLPTERAAVSVQSYHSLPGTLCPAECAPTYS